MHSASKGLHASSVFDGKASLQVLIVHSGFDVCPLCAGWMDATAQSSSRRAQCNCRGASRSRGIDRCSEQSECETTATPSSTHVSSLMYDDELEHRCVCWSDLYCMV